MFFARLLVVGCNYFLQEQFPYGAGYLGHLPYLWYPLPNAAKKLTSSKDPLAAQLSIYHLPPMISCTWERYSHPQAMPFGFTHVV